MLLTDVLENKNYIVLAVNYPNKTILSRLIDLGVVTGANLTGIRKPTPNACALILVNSRLIAVSNEICKTIAVKMECNNERSN